MKQESFTKHMKQDKLGKVGGAPFFNFWRKIMALAGNEPIQKEWESWYKNMREFLVWLPVDRQQVSSVVVSVSGSLSFTGVVPEKLEEKRYFAGRLSVAGNRFGAQIALGMIGLKTC